MKQLCAKGRKLYAKLRANLWIFKHRNRGARANPRRAFPHWCGAALKGRGFTGCEKRPVLGKTGKKYAAGAKEVSEEIEILGEIGETRPSAAKAGIDPVGFMRGLKPPPPSDETESASLPSFSAACSAPIHFAGLAARLKSCPVTKQVQDGVMVSFSAACLAPIHFVWLAARSAAADRALSKLRLLQRFLKDRLAH